MSPLIKLMSLSPVPGKCSRWLVIIVVPKLFSIRVLMVGVLVEFSLAINIGLGAEAWEVGGLWFDRT